MCLKFWFEKSFGLKKKKGKPFSPPPSFFLSACKAQSPRPPLLSLGRGPASHLPHPYLSRPLTSRAHQLAPPSPTVTPLSLQPSRNYQRGSPLPTTPARASTVLKSARARPEPHSLSSFPSHFALSLARTRAARTPLEL